MIKISKYCKFVLLMIILLLSLSGCVSLKDLKDSQAFWKDSKKDTIVWQGKEYHYLTDLAESHLNLDYDYMTYIDITKEDIPVLLARYSSDQAYVSEDKQFINLWEKIYCIEDRYEKMKELLKNPPKMECYAYRFFDNDDAGSDRFCILTEKQKKQLKEIIEESKIEKDYSQEEYYWVAETFASSADGMFRNYLGRDLCQTVDGELFWEVATESTYAAYEIPETYYKDVKEIFAEPLRVSKEKIMTNEE